MPSHGAPSGAWCAGSWRIVPQLLGPVREFGVVWTISARCWTSRAVMASIHRWHLARYAGLISRTGTPLRCIGIIGRQQQLSVGRRTGPGLFQSHRSPASGQRPPRRSRAAATIRPDPRYPLRTPAARRTGSGHSDCCCAPIAPGRHHAACRDRTERGSRVSRCRPGISGHPRPAPDPRRRQHRNRLPVRTRPAGRGTLAHRERQRARKCSPPSLSGITNKNSLLQVQ
jgi:hypothetical protein